MTFSSRFLAAITSFLLLSGIVSAQYPSGGFHTGYPSEPVRGYFQPVMIRTPEDTTLAGVADGQFTERLPRPLQAGFLIGCDYRLRVAGIPFHPGKELFPTITLIARTYPPQRLEIDFPIVVNITLEDLELALAGRYITRVIYLENPKAALPIPASGDEQVTHDINGGDPVAVAATQGLPVAIVRIGGRVPTQNGPDGVLSPEFCFGSPPWLLNSTTPPDNVAFHDVAFHNVAIQGANSPVSASILPNTLSIDPSLKSAGDSVFERRQEWQPNAWHPPHNTAVPGGRADEYLVSGGNASGYAGKPAYVENNSWTVHNFNAGDTVAHFDTLGGQVFVEPSNPLYIYAPRFGAIRKVEGLLLEGQVTALVAARNQQGVNRSEETQQTSFTEQEARTRYARTQDQLNSIDGQRRSTGVESSQGLGGYDNFQIVDSDSMILLQRTFGFENASRVHLDRMAQNARAWQGNEGIKIQINELAPMATVGIDGAAVYFQVEDRQSHTSKLRFIKVASKESAQPGEVVEFTLRFDNIGNQLIGNVTILDDLTGRLEFLDYTAVASLASGFSAQRNAGGSLRLRFEITEPLAPGEFGVIQYQCRLR